MISYFSGIWRKHTPLVLAYNTYHKMLVFNSRDRLVWISLIVTTKDYKSFPDPKAKYLFENVSLRDLISNQNLKWRKYLSMLFKHYRRHGRHPRWHMPAGWRLLILRELCRHSDINSPRSPSLIRTVRRPRAFPPAGLNCRIFVFGAVKAFIKFAGKVQHRLNFSVKLVTARDTRA